MVKYHHGSKIMEENERLFIELSDSELEEFLESAFGDAKSEALQEAEIRELDL